MPLVKVGPKNQVVIPKPVRAELGINPGDYVDVSVHNQTARITRRGKGFPETDEPIGPKTRAGIRQGLKDVEEGRVTGPFQSMAACLADLQKQQRPPKR